MLRLNRKNFVSLRNEVFFDCAHTPQVESIVGRLVIHPKIKTNKIKK